MNTLPFADHSFDGVISAHMLEHLPNPIQGLREMVRVLRPGAPLVLVVTQSKLLGWLIQWHWGNRCFRQKELLALMRVQDQAGTEYFLADGGFTDWTQQLLSDRGGALAD